MLKMLCLFPQIAHTKIVENKLNCWTRILEERGYSELVLMSRSEECTVAVARCAHLVPGSVS